MTNTSARSRQSAGQPTGGQFATEVKSADTGVELGGDPKPVREAVGDFRKEVEARHPGVTFDLWTKSGGYVSLDKIDVPSDRRRQGLGTQIMDELVAEADAQGWSLSLTADPSFGSSRKRLVEFYKRFGFVENKGRNKDFATLAGMIRSPRQR